MVGTRRELSLGGTTVSSIEYGSGSHTVLFLHGWGGSALSFQELWTAMRPQPEQYRFIALDFPGFGESPEPPLPWSVRDYMECVVQYLDALNLTTVDLVTHSFGGRVALYLAGEHPERINRAALLAAAGKKTNPKKVGTIRTVARAVKSIMTLPGLRRLFPTVRAFGYKAIGGHDYLKVDGVMKTTFQQVVDEDLTHLFSSFSPQTLLFWGEHDGYVPVAVAHEMEQTLPSATLTVYPDGKHGIHRTHAHRIGPELISFFDQQSTPAV